MLFFTLTLFSCLLPPILGFWYFYNNEKPKNFHYKEIFLFILKALIFLGVIAFVMYLNRFDILTIDDIGQPFFKNDSIFNMIKIADHGRYIGWIFMHFIVDGLPRILHVHPLDCLYSLFIRGFIFAITFYLIAKVFQIFQKKVNIFVFLIVILLGFYKLSGSSFSHHNQNFAYLMNFCCFFPMFYVVLKHFLKNQPFKRKEILKNSFFAFIMGISAHFNFIIMVGILGFLSFYLFLKAKNKKHFLKKILLPPIYLPLIFFIIGILLSIFSSNFQYLMAYRSPEENKIDFIFSHFFEYTRLFFPYFWHQHRLEGWCFLYLSVAILFLWKKHQEKLIKPIIFFFAILFGIIFFYYTLLSCGNTFYDGKSYWFVQTNLADISSFLLISGLLIVFQAVWQIIKQKRKTIMGLFLSAFLGLFIYSFFAFPMHLNKFGTSSLNERILTYQMEKAFLFYSLKNKPIYYPKNTVSVMWEKNCQEKNKSNAPKCHWAYEAYQAVLQYRYHIKLSFNSYGMNPKDFIQKAKKEGLIFTKKELTELKFTNLFDFIKNNGETK